MTTYTEELLYKMKESREYADALSILHNGDTDSEIYEEWIELFYAFQQAIIWL